MCAINPIHKKRIIFDFYTSHPMTKEEFENIIFFVVTSAEQKINMHTKLRVHVKETEQEAD